MKKIATSLRLIYYYLICLPHILLLTTHKKGGIIKADTRRWLAIMDKPYSLLTGFVYLISYYPEFRNLFYYRIGGLGKILNLYCPKMNSLFIESDFIDEGLFIQHGFATIIAAKSIGKNCWINQQVTIGYSNKNDCPVLLDNVTINAGAKVIGGVKIGSNSKVGANSVVVKDIPPDCVVVGVPAYIVKRNGIKVKEML